MQYDVNVRAVIKATVIDPEAVAQAEGWEIYDLETLERDAEGHPVCVEIRCDQLVTVEADKPEEAIAAAKDLATTIVLEGYEIDGVMLWSDEGIDVSPAAANDAPTVPGP